MVSFKDQGLIREIVTSVCNVDNISGAASNGPWSQQNNE
jgi:hypothetical protein